MKGKTYPQDFYLVRDKDGNSHFYSADPMNNQNRMQNEVNLADVLFGFFGPADVVNPLIIRVAGIIHERGQRFDISAPGKIRCGEMAKHLEDMDGNIVEILQMRSPNVSFPLNGIVMGRDGKMFDQRLYDGTGACSDGNEYHRLVIMDGVLVNTSDEKDDAAGGGDDSDDVAEITPNSAEEPI